MPIQGTASELIKIAMIKIDEEINIRNMESKMILQVHDELLFEVPLSEKNDLIDMVAKIMENSMEFKVPIKVDCNFGNNWYEAH
jgi:DNA polymerase-1